MNIALLEDDKQLHRAIKEVLTSHHHTCYSFYDGDSFIENFSNYPTDLYILDINVPGVNGLELLNYLIQYDPYSKVIIISADSTLETIERAYSNGCMDYLKKPFYLQELLFKVEQHTPKFPKLKEGEHLTKKEQLFIELLLQNAPQTVSYEKIEEVIYDGKDLNLDALRALVKRLRAKLDSAKIISVSQVGYKIELTS